MKKRAAASQHDKPAPEKLVDLLQEYSWNEAVKMLKLANNTGAAGRGSKT